jgi:predicted aspartyl protease
MTFAEVRITCLSWLLLSCAAGCRSVVTSDQRGLSSQERAYLNQAAHSPDTLGIELVKHGQTASARWHETVDIGEAVTVPLLAPDFYRSAQPVLVALINGGPPLPLVLDTGAPVNLVHVSAARANQVRIADPQKMGDVYHGLNGTEQTCYGMIDRLSIGSLRFRNVLTAVRTRLYLRKFLGVVPVFRWEGNSVGMTTLTRFSYLTIHYRRGEARFAAREFFSDTNNPSACRVPFRLEAMQILAELRVNGSEPLNAMIDTGSDAGLMLSDSLVSQLGLAECAAKGKTGRYVGLGGEMTTHAFVLPAIELGGTTFTNVPAVSVPVDYPVSLGSGFLKQYKVTFDFRRKMLWLEK